jgi:PAS domain S-box-containing protein
MIRILVVDDVKEIVEVVKYILEESNPGFTVDCALSVEEALIHIKKHEYDVIISDYYMPEATGLDLLKQIRAMNMTIPFIIQTGQGDSANATEALQNGADFFFEKGSEGPLQFLEFTQIINLLVSKRRKEIALNQNILKYRQLFELHREGLIFVNNEDIIQEVNTSFSEIIEKNPSEIIGKRFQDIMVDKHGLYAPDLKKQAYDKGRSNEINTEVLIPDGKRLKLLISALAVKNDQNELVGMWILIREGIFG